MGLYEPFIDHSLCLSRPSYLDVCVWFVDCFHTSGSLQFLPIFSQGPVVQRSSLQSLQGGFSTS